MLRMEPGSWFSCGLQVPLVHASIVSSNELAHLSEDPKKEDELPQTAMAVTPFFLKALYSLSSEISIYYAH